MQNYRSILITIVIFVMLIIGSSGASANDTDELLQGIAIEQQRLGQRLDLQIERQLQPKLELSMEIPNEEEFLAKGLQARSQATSPASIW